MHIISEKELREFWADQLDAQSPLRGWIRVVRLVKWRSFAELRQTYPHADQVGDLTVFNVGGNKYRLIAEIDFKYQKIFLKHVLTHQE